MSDPATARYSVRLKFLAETRRLQVQQAYALGLSFTPLEGKKPVLTNWTGRPRESLQEALEFARQGNVGVRTGATSGVVVVDIDPGCDPATLAKFESIPTPTVKTGRGGRHFYFRMPADAELGNRSWAALHIDVRGTGGQVVFPGSVHPETGEPYEWVRSPEETPLADWPADLMAEIEVANAAAKPARSVPKRAPRKSSDLSYGNAAIKSECDQLAQIQKGGRNHALNTAAFKLGRIVGAGEADERDVFDSLFSVAANWLGDDFTETEARKTIGSGIRAGKRDPKIKPDLRPDLRPDLPTDRPADRPGKPASSPDAEPSARHLTPLGQRDPETGMLVLSPKKTVPTADAYLREFHTHVDGMTLRTYAGVPFVWRNNRHEPIEQKSIEQALYAWLHTAGRYVQNRETKQPELVDFEANPSTVGHACQTILARTYLASEIIAPAWFPSRDGDPPADEMLVCKSESIHLPTMKRVPPTPRLFVTASLNFDYDDDAPQPRRWMEFLNQVFPNDPESIVLLQQWFGYCLTMDTRQQKIMLMIGLTRSGKGTVARVLTQLIGAGNVASPTSSSLAGDFGLQSLIGKSLAIIPDARFRGDKTSTVEERLLSISGEDTLTIDRKFLPSITMKLPTRFCILTNRTPGLTDSSGALARRFIVLHFKQSFLNREDHGLTDALLAELPGILRWAIDGWISLRESGRFFIPKSSQESIEELEDSIAPIGGFIRERCNLGPDEWAYANELFESWKDWCAEQGRDKAGTSKWFGRDLRSFVSGLSRHQSRDGWFYQGISLKNQ